MSQITPIELCGGVRQYIETINESMEDGFVSAQNDVWYEVAISNKYPYVRTLLLLMYFYEHQDEFIELSCSYWFIKAQ